jgi:predicted PurR-regulated permease PerM
MASVRGTVIGLGGVGLGGGLLLGIACAAAGVPHPVPLGALTTLAAMVPFGAPVVFGVVALWLLSPGALAPAFAVLGFGLAVVFVADYIVRPFLIGGATRLPVRWVLLGILGGGGGLGAAGPVHRSGSHGSTDAVVAHMDERRVLGTPNNQTKWM